MTNKIVTPSKKPITEGEIGKLCELLTARLKKSPLMSEPMQDILHYQGNELIDDFMTALQKRVDAVSTIISRKVQVDRNRTPQEVLNATDRKQYITKSVVPTMPSGEGEEVEVFFFKPELSGRNGYISDDDLEEEYELRGLYPADPYSQAAVNEADPRFADEHPNGTHWKDAGGDWCYTAFRRWSDERSVRVDRDDDDWSAYWWFAGLRKGALKS